MIKVDPKSLQQQISGLKNEERTSVVSSFLELMSAMVDVFAKYVIRSPSSEKVSMKVSEAQMHLVEVESRERNKLPDDKTLRKMVCDVSETFLKDGPLTSKRGSESDEKEAFLELPSLPDHYKQARPAWKTRAEGMWKSHILNNYMHRFIQEFQGNRVETVQPYTKEESALLGKEASEFVLSHELPSGEYAFLKIGEKRLASRLLESPFLETPKDPSKPEIDKRGYADILKSWGYKLIKVLIPEKNDLLVDTSSNQVFRYVGDGKVQCKYGNDSRFVVEERYRDVANKCDHSVWRHPNRPATES